MCVSSFLQIRFEMSSKILKYLPMMVYEAHDSIKALSDGAIFLVTCDAILLLGDVKLANACFHHSLPIYF